jgi:hypothetical protein
VLHLVDRGEERLHLPEELAEVRRRAEAPLVAFERIPFNSDDEVLRLLYSAGNLEGETVLVLLEQGARPRVGGFERRRLIGVDRCSGCTR